MYFYVDETHVSGRAVTGIERITLELFSPEALEPLPIVPVRASGTPRMIAAQMLGLPARLAMSTSAMLLCPGFPPSPLLLPFADRVVPYIHDLFLLTRPEDLNLRAKAYMAAPFRLAVHRYPRFFVNSEHTRNELANVCRPDAEIALYRPCVRDVFGLARTDRLRRTGRSDDDLRLVALGTVEPRKNLTAAGAIVRTLSKLRPGNVRLDVIGRGGWGPDWTALEGMPEVTLHGYQPSEQVRELIAEADALITTSHDEGCGIPMLEAQHAGLPIIAPDRDIYREVLGSSGVYINPRDALASARTIADVAVRPRWRQHYAELAKKNLIRWNGLAATDRERVIELLNRLLRPTGPSAPSHEPRSPGLKREPRISVVILNYNYEAFVGDAIQSVLSQTYANVECIVVDDGSTDRSLEIIESFPGIRVIRQRNRGQAGAARAGLACLTGEIVLFLDSDDLLFPDACATIAQHWQPEAAALLYRLAIIRNCALTGESLPTQSFLRSNFAEFVREYGYLPAAPSSGNAYSVDFARKTFSDAEGLDDRRYFDSWLLYCAPFCGHVITIDQSLGAYRIHENNASLAGKRTLYRLKEQTCYQYWAQRSAARLDPRGAPGATAWNFLKGPYLLKWYILTKHISAPHFDLPDRTEKACAAECCREFLTYPSIPLLKRIINCALMCAVLILPQRIWRTALQGLYGRNA